MVGEGGQYGPPEPVASCIVHVLAPQILGRNPLDRGRIGLELYAATRDFGQKGSYIEAMSAIDIALWDIAGKALGVPVCRLLGGAFRDSVPAYANWMLLPGRHIPRPPLHAQTIWRWKRNPTSLPVFACSK